MHMHYYPPHTHTYMNMYKFTDPRQCYTVPSCMHVRTREADPGLCRPEPELFLGEALDGAHSAPWLGGAAPIDWSSAAKTQNSPQERPGEGEELWGLAAAWEVGLLLWAADSMRPTGAPGRGERRW